MAVMGQKPDCSEGGWDARVSDMEIIGKRQSRVKQGVHLKGDVGMFIDLGKSPGEREPLKIQGTVTILSPLCVHTCFKIVSPGLNYSFVRN